MKYTVGYGRASRTMSTHEVPPVPTFHRIYSNEEGVNPSSAERGSAIAFWTLNGGMKKQYTDKNVMPITPSVLHHPKEYYTQNRLKSMPGVDNSAVMGVHLYGG